MLKILMVSEYINGIKMSNMCRTMKIAILAAVLCTDTLICKIRIINLSDNITSSIGMFYQLSRNQKHETGFFHPQFCDLFRI